MYQYRNPVLRGFHPDPSICRVGDDFYLVTSTFEYFPGVPVFHSKNLVDWELINHCLTRPSQLDLSGRRASGGVYAPTIRYHDGVFYMVTTDVGGKGHLLVHTTDIRGAWSEPVYIDHEGIDPSLTFADGGVYFCCTGRDADGAQGIALFEIDVNTGAMLTEPRIISRGSGGKYPEGPHIYQKNGMFYLMLSEGGTEYGHMVTLFRSKNIYGPYTARPHNPMVTHRDRMTGQIQAVGHPDLVEDQNGNLWMVCLGIRTIPGVLLHHIGRETFLVPARWTDDGWIKVGNNGTMELTMEGPLPGAPDKKPRAFTDDFSAPVLDRRWTYLRKPDMDNYRVNADEKALILTGTDVTLSTPKASPTFIGIRQPEFDMTASVRLSGPLKNGQRAGITAFYNDSYHYDLYLTRRYGAYYIGLSKRIHDFEAVVCEKPVGYKGDIRFAIIADAKKYIFAYSAGAGFNRIGSGMTAGLATEGTHTMTFTGTFIGLFSERGTARFGDFRLSPKKG
ncbi:MAG: glycoside hydrolase family 43 protein [Oscillospiraceae bacterium]|jgi:alpha-N-arabinofuranosidase|nr:glycoside hydrolase family 43 protein [Oscillospiraceae bacterium]